MSEIRLTQTEEEAVRVKEGQTGDTAALMPLTHQRTFLLHILLPSLTPLPVKTLKPSAEAPQSCQLLQIIAIVVTVNGV